MRVPADDLYWVLALAQSLHCLVFMTFDSRGDYQPLLLPVSDAVWARILH